MFKKRASVRQRNNSPIHRLSLCDILQYEQGFFRLATDDEERLPAESLAQGRPVRAQLVQGVDVGVVARGIQVRNVLGVGHGQFWQELGVHERLAAEGTGTLPA